MRAGGQEFRGNGLYKSAGMAHGSWFYFMWLLVPALLTLHVAVCLLLVLVVLMQLPRSEGLGAAFGGGMTENIFGAQTTHVLARFTVWLGVAFFVLTLLLAVAYARADSAKGSKVQEELMAAPVPVEAAATPTPAEPPVGVLSTAPTTGSESLEATGSTETSVAPTSTPEAVATPVAPEAEASPVASPAAATP